MKILICLLALLISTSIRAQTPQKILTRNPDTLEVIQPKVPSTFKKDQLEQKKKWERALYKARRNKKFW